MRRKGSVQQRLRNLITLDLRGTLIDARDADIAIEPLDDDASAIPGTAGGLDGAIHSLRSGFGPESFSAPFLRLSSTIAT
jgi:hypothetical protein